ncbi:MAG: hypothetical protein KC486_23505 [Myxococcales bacterium]|nr:hypothetical protein [Myxococcales bacterium]
MIRSSVVVVSALLLPVAAARADVAPPADYVDPCESAELDASCRRCTSPEFKDPDCHKQALAAGQELRCQGWSYAMYCGGEPAPSLQDLAAADPAPVDPAPAPPDAAAPAATAKPASDSPTATPEDGAAKTAEGGRCALQGEGSAPAPALLVLLLALVGRRRRWP